MEAKRPKLFNINIKSEIKSTINQLNGVFSNYLAELQTVHAKQDSMARHKQR